MKKRFKEVSS